MELTGDIRAPGTPPIRLEHVGHLRSPRALALKPGDIYPKYG